MNGRTAVGVALLAACALVVTAAPAEAQRLEDYDYENLTFRGIGAGIGYQWPNKVESTQVWNLRFDLGYLGPGVRIVPTLSYWSSTMKESELNRLANQINQLAVLQGTGVEVSADDLGPIEWSDVTLGLEGQFVWTTPVDVLTYVGTGLQIHALNGQGDAIEDTFVEDLLDSFASGIVGIGGAEYMFRERFRAFGEVRYTLMSDLHFPSVHVGGAIMLPSRED